MGLLRQLRGGAVLDPVILQRLAELGLLLVCALGQQRVGVGVQLLLVVLIGLGLDLGQLLVGVLIQSQLRGLRLGHQLIGNHVLDGLLIGRLRGDQLRLSIGGGVAHHLALMVLLAVEREQHGILVLRRVGGSAQKQNQRQQRRESVFEFHGCEPPPERM